MIVAFRIVWLFINIIDDFLRLLDENNIKTSKFYPRQKEGKPIKNRFSLFP